MYASEGGTRVPLIMSGPGIEPQSFNNAINFVIDVAPTIAELAGAGNTHMDGRSLVPVLKGTADETYHDADSIGIELSGNSALFKGGYKLTRNTLPLGDGEWRLHDLKQDPAERTDLSDKMPDLRQKMLEDYQKYAAENGVVELPKDFDLAAQINSNVAGKLLETYAPTLIGIIMGFVVLVALLFSLGVRRKRAKARASHL